MAEVEMEEVVKRWKRKRKAEAVEAVKKGGRGRGY